MSLLARTGAILVAMFALVAISSGSASAGGPAIEVGDFYYCNDSFQGGVCETTINAGDTVTWNWIGQAPHTVTECGASCDSPTGSPLFESGFQSQGASFQETFNTPGTYLYYCEVHPAQQRGRIVVQGGRAPPTNTPVSGGPTDPGATVPSGGGPTATVSAGSLPSTGTTGGASSSGLWVLVIGLAGAAATVAGLGAMAYRRSQA